MKIYLIGKKSYKIMEIYYTFVYESTNATKSGE